MYLPIIFLSDYSFAVLPALCNERVSKSFMFCHESKLFLMQSFNDDKYNYYAL